MHAGVFGTEQPMTPCRCIQPLKPWFSSAFKLVPQLPQVYLPISAVNLKKKTHTDFPSNDEFI